MATTVLIASDESAFYKKAAQIFLETAASAVKEKGKCAVALSGGSTPAKFFALLADAYHRERLPWPKLFFFWSDERCVPPSHSDSNYRMAHEALLSKVPVPAQNIFRVPAEMQSPAEAARAYEQTLRVFFKGTGGLPLFDLMLLGMGDDGHTASLFPGTTAVNEKIHWVAANHVEKLSANRLTLTFPVINNASRVLFLCAGESKASILKEIFNENSTRPRYPAQLVNPVNGELIWLLDKAAASKLTGNVKKNAVRV